MLQQLSLGLRWFLTLVDWGQPRGVREPSTSRLRWERGSTEQWLGVWRFEISNPSFLSQVGNLLKNNMIQEPARRQVRSGQNVRFPHVYPLATGIAGVRRRVCGGGGLVQNRPQSSPLRAGGFEEAGALEEAGPQVLAFPARLPVR